MTKRLPILFYRAVYWKGPESVKYIFSMIRCDVLEKGPTSIELGPRKQ